MSASRRRFYWVDCLPFADCRHSTAQTRPPPRSQGGAAGVRELAGVGADSPAVTMQSLLEKGAKQAGARRSNSGVLPIASVTDRSTFARFGVVIRTLAPPASMTVAAVRRHENSDNRTGVNGVLVNRSLSEDETAVESGRSCALVATTPARTCDLPDRLRQSPGRRRMRCAIVAPGSKPTRDGCYQPSHTGREMCILSGT